MLSKWGMFLSGRIPLHEEASQGRCGFYFIMKRGWMDGGPQTAGQTVNEWGMNERMWTVDGRWRMAEDGLSRLLGGGQTVNE
jgi:hypothetical protein